MHVLQPFDSWRTYRILIYICLTLGVATLGASGQGNKTNGDTRCAKIAWFSGIRFWFIRFRWFLAEVIHWHIEFVGALVDVVCAAVLNT